MKKKEERKRKKRKVFNFFSFFSFLLPATIDPELEVEDIWTDKKERECAQRVFVTQPRAGGPLLVNLVLPTEHQLLVLELADGSDGLLHCRPAFNMPASDAIPLAVLTARRAGMLGDQPLAASHEPDESDGDLDTEMSVLAETEPPHGAPPAATHSYPAETLVLSDRRLALYWREHRVAGVLVMVSDAARPADTEDVTARITALTEPVHNRFSICLEPSQPPRRLMLSLAPQARRHPNKGGKKREKDMERIKSLTFFCSFFFG